MNERFETLTNIDNGLYNCYSNEFPKLSYGCGFKYRRYNQCLIIVNRGLILFQFFFIYSV